MKNRWILPQRLWTVQMVETTMLVLSPSGTFSTDSLKSRCLLLHPGDNFIFAEPLDPDMAACVGALAPVSHHANQKYLSICDPFSMLDRVRHQSCLFRHNSQELDWLIAQVLTCVPSCRHPINGAWSPVIVDHFAVLRCISQMRVCEPDNQARAHVVHSRPFVRCQADPQYGHRVVVELGAHLSWPRRHRLREGIRDDRKSNQML